MKSFSLKIDLLTGEEYYEVGLSGRRLLEDPLLNKGEAFADEERHRLGLTGLLRAAVNSLDQQVTRALENYRRKGTDLERYIYLQALQDRNETLFFRLLRENLVEMMPIVYTPTVGDACLHMSHIMRRYRGIYLSPDTISHVDEVFDNVSRPEIRLIVVTDGERILGLGDLGSDGMGIPVGKVNLYVAAGGLHPGCCLPVCLDVGTNNEALRNDPMYLGARQPRLVGDEYDRFVERFVLGVRRKFPSALLQWEDFGKHHAFDLLERYRDRILSFNDDIQGTGATALAALMSAMRIKGSRFADETFAIVGMGQAGVGIARCIAAMLREEGLGPDEVRRRILGIDVGGLLVAGTPGLDATQLPFAQLPAEVAAWAGRPGPCSLDDVVAGARPTVLIGVTGRTGLFSRAMIARVATHTPRPVFMALSNPTSRSECTPEDVAVATGGRGLLATGSPFASIEHGGHRFVTSQCNNLYVFPGVGLGVLVAQALKVTDRMFLAASRALSSMMTEAQLAEGRLLPEMDRIRDVSFEVARAVAIEARDAGLGRRLEDGELAALVRKAQWEPQYLPYRPAPGA